MFCEELKECDSANVNWFRRLKCTECNSNVMKEKSILLESHENKRRHENIEKRTAGLYCSTYGNPLVGSVGPCSVFSGLRFVIFNGVWVGFLKSKCYLGAGGPTLEEGRTKVYLQGSIISSTVAMIDH